MASVSLSIQRQRQQAEAAGDEIESEQHDEDEADRKDQRADQRLIGLHRAGDGKACRSGEDRTGKPAANDQIGGRQRKLAAPGIDHGGGDVCWLHIIHIPAPVRKASRNGVTRSRRAQCPLAATQQAACHWRNDLFLLIIWLRFDPSAVARGNER